MHVLFLYSLYFTIYFTLLFLYFTLLFLYFLYFAIDGYLGRSFYQLLNYYHKIYICLKLRPPFLSSSSIFLDLLQLAVYCMQRMLTYICMFIIMTI